MEYLTLKEWTINFVKHKDLFKKSLKAFDVENNIIRFHFSDKDAEYMILEDLDASVIDFVRQPGNKYIVCLGRRNNLKFLVDNWSELKIIPNLSFIFVDVKRNLRWIISPYVHDRICDDYSLVLGLKTMYSNIFP